MDVSRGFILFVVGALGAVSLAIAWPFLQYVLLAVLIAYLLTPVYRRLEPAVGGTGAALALMTVRRSRSSFPLPGWFPSSPTTRSIWPSN